MDDDEHHLLVGEREMFEVDELVVRGLRQVAVVMVYFRS